MVANQLTWKAVTSYNHLEARDTEGTWKVGPAGSEQTATIGFQLHGWTRNNFDELMASYENADENSREKARIGNMLSIGSKDQGSAATQGDAQVAIEVLRNGDTGLLVEEALAAAGFVYAPNPYIKNDRRYKRKSPNGTFSLVFEDDSVVLRHDRRGSRYSDPLFRLMLKQPTFKQDGTVWFIWPERVEQNFQTLAIQAAIRIADDYVASGRNSARRKRSAA